jgi:hypothetical protein
MQFMMWDVAPLTANIDQHLNWHCQLIRPSRDKPTWRRLNHSGNAADFGPHPECLRPGDAVLDGSGVIAAEVEEIIDLIVG